MGNLNNLLYAFGKNPIHTKECFGANTFVLTVPDPNHELYIAIGQKGNIKEPHVHIFRSENDMINWTRGVPLSLIRNTYITHPGERIIQTLSEQELHMIRSEMMRRTDVVIMSQRLNITNWKYTFNTWNEYNEKFELNTKNYRIPHYQYKDIKKGVSIL